MSAQEALTNELLGHLERSREETRKYRQELQEFQERRVGQPLILQAHYMKLDFRTSVLWLCWCVPCYSKLMLKVSTAILPYDNACMQEQQGDRLTESIQQMVQLIDDVLGRWHDGRMIVPGPCINSMATPSWAQPARQSQQPRPMGQDEDPASSPNT